MKATIHWRILQMSTSVDVRRSKTSFLKLANYFEHRIILLRFYTNNQIVDWRKQLKREERAEINGWKLKKKVLEHMFSFNCSY